MRERKCGNDPTWHSAFGAHGSSRAHGSKHCLLRHTSVGGHSLSVVQPGSSVGPNLNQKIRKN